MPTVELGVGYSGEMAKQVERKHIAFPARASKPLSVADPANVSDSGGHSRDDADVYDFSSWRVGDFCREGHSMKLASAQIVESRNVLQITRKLRIGLFRRPGGMPGTL